MTPGGSPAREQRRRRRRRARTDVSARPRADRRAATETVLRARRAPLADPGERGLPRTRATRPGLRVRHPVALSAARHLRIGRAPTVDRVRARQSRWFRRSRPSPSVDERNWVPSNSPKWARSKCLDRACCFSAMRYGGNAHADAVAKDEQEQPGLTAPPLGWSTVRAVRIGASCDAIAPVSATAASRGSASAASPLLLDRSTSAALRRVAAGFGEKGAVGHVLRPTPGLRE